MKSLCHGILAWIRGITIMSLATLANDAPRLQHFAPPSVCVGHKLTLPWIYGSSLAPALTITWTVGQDKKGNDNIVIATLDVTSRTLQLSPSAEPVYKGRISYIDEKGYNAGIELTNFTASDTGYYGVIVSFAGAEKNLTDSVFVQLTDVQSNVIESRAAYMCSIASTPTSLYWEINNPMVRTQDVCRTPTMAEWRKNGKVIARMDQEGSSLLVVPTDNLPKRLFRDTRFALGIIIDPTEIIDEGRYSINAEYGNLANITSNVINLNVSFEMRVSDVEDIKQCVGTDAVFPWDVIPGTDCSNVTRTVKNIFWKKLFVRPGGVVASVVGGHFIASKKHFGRADESNAGLMIREVKESDGGTYEVSITFTNGEDIRSRTKLTVDTPQISIAPVNNVEKCEGEFFVFDWTFVHEQENTCDDPTVTSRTWYFNGENIMSKVEPTEEPLTLPTLFPRSTPKEITPEETDPKATTPQESTTTETTPTTIPQEEVTTTTIFTTRQTPTEPSTSEETSDHITSQQSPDSGWSSSGAVLGETGSGEDIAFEIAASIFVNRTLAATQSNTRKNRAADEVLKAANQLRSPPRGPRSAPERPENGSFSIDPRFDAGLAVEGVKSENTGSYYVNITFYPPVKKSSYVVSEITNLTVTKAPTVSLRDPVTGGGIRLCSDEVLELKWNVERHDCASPFLISWHFQQGNETEQEIGSSYNKYHNFIDDYKMRVALIEGTNLKFTQLTTNDSGTYTIRLSYQGVSDTNNITRNVVFAQSPVAVTVYDSLSVACTGRKFASVEIHLTRNGEDVRVSSNRTVSVSDRITVSGVIPSNDEMSSAVFFWKETQHTLLKQYFGRKCRQAGLCSIQWKVSTRCPGIIFRHNEFRREVQIGLKINYMSKKHQTPMTSFYFRNYKDITDSTDPQNEDSDGSKSKSGAIRQCVVSSQAVLAITTFLVLLLHRRH